MKILLLAPQPFFQHRGTPIAVKLLAQALGETGHFVYLLVYHEGENILLPHVVLDRIPKIFGIKNIPPGFSFKKLVCDALMLVKCLYLMRRQKFDVIHAVEESVFIAIILKKLFAVPIIYDMDSCLSDQVIEKYKNFSFFKKILSFFEREAVRQSVGVIAVCKALENIARQYGPRVPILRLEDISLLAESTASAESLQKIQEKGPIIMYVGNLEFYQGTDLLLQSFQKVIEKIPLAQLVIIGGSRPHIFEYRQQAEALNIDEQTHFLGQRPISQLAGYLSQADIVVSPRIQGNNTPMKIYSYLDCGRPLAATRLPTHTQVLSDDTAMLVEPKPSSMAKGIIDLIASPDLAQKLAKNAKTQVAQEFCYSAFKRKLSYFYKSLESKTGDMK